MKPFLLMPVDTGIYNLLLTLLLKHRWLQHPNFMKQFAGQKKDIGL
jgi:hypothetical protein